jgi:hypothetical protein
MSTCCDKISQPSLEVGVKPSIVAPGLSFEATGGFARVDAVIEATYSSNCRCSTSVEEAGHVQNVVAGRARPRMRSWPSTPSRASTELSSELTQQRHPEVHAAHQRGFSATANCRALNLDAWIADAPVSNIPHLRGFAAEGKLAQVNENISRLTPDKRTAAPKPATASTRSPGSRIPATVTSR